jgi:aminoglycoside 2''-phosphotransferase
VTTVSEPAHDYRTRIERISPGLEIRSLRTNDEGLMNDVVIVNEDTVYRFAKNDQAAESLQTELYILDVLRPHVRVSIPEPFYRSADAMAYPLLYGETLTRDRWLALDEPTRQAVAEQLGRFLQAMHNLPLTDEVRAAIPPTAAPCRRDDWLNLRDRVREQVYPLLLTHQRQWAERLFDHALEDEHTFEYTPLLVHGDLGPYHIVFDAMTRRVSSIIDFGTAGLGDPATDLGMLITVYGEKLVGRMAGVYLGLAELLPRARFYAQAIELQWVLLGLETGEPFWFTAHLGGARDVEAIGLRVAQGAAH